MSKKGPPDVTVTVMRYAWPQVHNLLLSSKASYNARASFELMEVRVARDVAAAINAMLPAGAILATEETPPPPREPKRRYMRRWE
jgi:hypothetical protein